MAAATMSPNLALDRTQPVMSRIQIEAIRIANSLRHSTAYRWTNLRSTSLMSFSIHRNRSRSGWTFGLPMCSMTR